MVGTTAGPATPQSGRWALLAFALDIAAVTSFACAPLVGGDFDTDAQTWGYLILAGVVPTLSALAGLGAPFRSVSVARKALGKLVAWALAVVSGILLLLCGVLFLFLLQGSP